MSWMRQGAAASTALLAAPVAAIGLALRPDWRVGWRERLGGGPSLRPGGVWLHAASAGEVLAGARLAPGLREGGQSLFMSASTSAGRLLLQTTLPDVASSLVPLDHPWCVDAALDRLRPRVLALVETEIWPTLIKAAVGRHAAVAIVSGRISDRSFPGYLQARPLLSPTLQRIAAVGARSDLDAERFARIGVPERRIEVTGDLKLAPPSAAPALDAELARVLAGGPVLVAGSTHEGEERVALEALAGCEAEGFALVIAPRAPARVDAILRWLRGSGRSVRRRSELDRSSPPLAVGEILVLDTLGELAAVYGAATLGFVGGSIVPVGGHNLLEPTMVGTPVAHGPHVESTREAARLLAEAGGRDLVTNGAELARAASRALAEPKAARAGVDRVREALAPHADSVARTLRLIGRVGAKAADRARRDGAVA